MEEREFFKEILGVSCFTIVYIYLNLPMQKNAKWKYVLHLIIFMGDFMEQEVVFTTNRNIDSAVSELCGKLKRDLSSYQAVIFMAAIDYDFNELSQKIKDRFPKAEVIGTSTAGEISAQGFTEGSIVLTTMQDSSNT